jgi:hypothetical protein
VTHKPPPPPKGAQAAGKRLWRAVLEGWQLEEHELVLLRHAVAVADVCDQLHELVESKGVLLAGRAHPALVELRNQQILLARLLVALRVPLGDQGDDSPRTQRRGLRGVYGTKGAA